MDIFDKYLNGNDTVNNLNALSLIYENDKFSKYGRNSRQKILNYFRQKINRSDVNGYNFEYRYQFSFMKEILSVCKEYQRLDILTFKNGRIENINLTAYKEINISKCKISNCMLKSEAIVIIDSEISNLRLSYKSASIDGKNLSTLKIK